MTDTTLLRLTGMGVPPYSARGLTQTLAPIAESIDIRRTVNAEAVDLSNPSFRKYRSTIQGNDQQPPALDAVWPGTILTVECIAELAYPVGGTPGKPVVGDTSTDATRTESGFVFYRPELEMMVMDFQIQRDEYGAQVSWTLELQET